jgi:hypothetical protein
MPDLEILLYRDEDRVGEINFAGFVALPDDLRHTRFPINLRTVQSKRFGNAHPSNTEDFGERSVTQA